MCELNETVVATDEVKNKVHEILDSYIKLNKLRKTPERDAILDTVYSMDSHFTLDMLDEEMKKRKFRVSRATLYNTMRLFIELRLAVRHRFIGHTKYEACYNNEKRIHQVCTICGTVTEIKSDAITKAVEQTKLKWFRKDGFTLYIYGVCSSCQRKISRKRNIKIKQQKIQS